MKLLSLLKVLVTHDWVRQIGTSIEKFEPYKTNVKENEH
jgi:hypothetical protein